MASARLYFYVFHITLSIISSLYASLAALMSIFNRFSVVAAFLIITLNSAALSVKIVIFRVLHNIYFRSCFMIMVVSQASANENVSASGTYLTTRLDLIFALSISLALS